MVDVTISQGTTRPFFLNFLAAAVPLSLWGAIARRPQDTVLLNYLRLLEFCRNNVDILSLCPPCY